ncbi:MAG: glycosyltransferase [Hymenobacter sp.]|nr:MAG: glycosyltransferase [Hymenobacter sp.]
MSSDSVKNGITVLICTHNGAKLLPPTLRHLAAQQMPPNLGWEILLISNASTDDTLAMAPRLWEELGSPAPMRVLNEPRPGKHFALPRGYIEAHYPYVCIVDDDNWLSPNYLQLAHEIIDANPEIGALGGTPEAVCEISPPSWFERYSGHYAIGRQAAESGDVSMKHGFICGAGCVIRQSAWQQVQAAGFETLLVKYPGGRVSGDDVENCFALRLAGYSIWFDDRLLFKHFISANRLQWAYLYSLYRSSAGAEVDLSPYRHYLRNTTDVKPLVWLRDGLYSIRNYVKYKWRTIRSGHWGSAATAVGSQDALNADFYWLTIQYYLRKQLKGDQGYEWVKHFKSRLEAQSVKSKQVVAAQSMVEKV